MISCGAMRAHMLDVARQDVSEAVSLEIESHVEECAACERECARWKLFGLLKADDPALMGEPAEKRILQQLLALGGAARPATRSAPRRGRLVLGLMSVAALGLGLFFVGQRVRGERPVAPVADGQVIDAVASGSVTFAGAAVHFGAGTHMTLHPEGRALSLSAGEVDVDVKPGLPGRFRVTTPKFTVEVLGTRFLVTMGSVRTLRGRVHVLDVQGRELAMLVAGDSWMASDVPGDVSGDVHRTAVLASARPPAPPPAPQPSSEPPPAPPEASVSLRGSFPTPRRVAPADGLARGRAALSRGETKQARALALRALSSQPTEHEAAALEMLLAHVLLVEKRPDEAVDAYRRVVRRRWRAPEAEVAQFAIGQLLFERGATVEAGVALDDYLARYPTGHFVREAREHLALIHPGR